MASNTTPAGLSVKACIQATLEQNTDLARAAYRREYRYTPRITEAVQAAFDVTVSRDVVQETVLECSRLGLLAEYAAVD